MSLDKTHAIVEIDSVKRTSGTISNFEMILNTPIEFKRKKARQYFMRIENIKIPTSFYNISSSFNTLKITEDPSCFLPSISEAVLLTLPTASSTDFASYQLNFCMVS